MKILIVIAEIIFLSKAIEESFKKMKIDGICMKKYPVPTMLMELTTILDNVCDMLMTVL